MDSALSFFIAVPFGPFGLNFIAFGPFGLVCGSELAPNPSQFFYSRSCQFYLPVPRSLPGALDFAVSFFIAVPFGFGQFFFRIPCCKYLYVSVLSWAKYELRS